MINDEGSLHVVGTKAFLRALPVKMTRNCDVILRELAAHPLLSREELIDSLYWLDPDGGPEHAENTLLVEIWKLRKCGYSIINYPGRGYSLAPGAGITV